MDIKRDENGRFVKGNGGGPGRKPRVKEQEYLATMISVVTPEHWRKICVKAMEQAERGDEKARKWLSDYILGAPIQRTEHSGEDGKPLEIIVRYVNGRTDAGPTA